MAFIIDIIIQCPQSFWHMHKSQNCAHRAKRKLSKKMDILKVIFSSVSFKTEHQEWKTYTLPWKPRKLKWLMKQKEVNSVLDPEPTSPPSTLFSSAQTCSSSNMQCSKNLSAHFRNHHVGILPVWDSCLPTVIWHWLSGWCSQLFLSIYKASFYSHLDLKEGQREHRLSLQNALSSQSKIDSRLCCHSWLGMKVRMALFRP